MQAAIPFFDTVPTALHNGRHTLQSLHGRGRQFIARTMGALLDPLGGSPFNLNTTLTASPFENGRSHTPRVRQGLRLQVRALRADDCAHLAAIYASMDDNSRYLRFHRVVADAGTGLFNELARQTLTAVTLGLLVVTRDAASNEIPVAVAYLVRHTEYEAELAISLRSDFQRFGIGTRLFMLLLDEACSRGFHHALADVLSENLGMQKLLARLPYTARQIRDGYSTLFKLDITSARSTARPTG